MPSLLSYSDLRGLSTFAERFKYLTLKGRVGQDTFGFDRYLNQQFYRSREWKRCREDVIIRDNACDLGIEGYEIHDRVYIHHMNPMTVDQVVNGEDLILDPEFLICVTHQTHNAIHYGTAQVVPGQLVERRPGDTKSW